MAKTDLTAQRLRELLHYDPDTGVFTWLDDRGRGLRGKPAGIVHPIYGYLRIEVFSVAYAAHRLAWLYMTGDWPKSYVDHIDRTKLNNRFRNLRLVTRSENAQNIDSVRSDNILGVRGVTLRGSKFMARITVDGKSTCIGTFCTLEEAKSAYQNAKRRLHPAYAIE